MDNQKTVSAASSWRRRRRKKGKVSHPRPLTTDTSSMNALIPRASTDQLRFQGCWLTQQKGYVHRHSVGQSCLQTDAVVRRWNSRCRQWRYLSGCKHSNIIDTRRLQSRNNSVMTSAESASRFHLSRGCVYTLMNQVAKDLGILFSWAVSQWTISQFLKILQSFRRFRRKLWRHLVI